IERIYVREATCSIWEIARYRRCKAGILSLARVNAVEDVLGKPRENRGRFPSDELASQDPEIRDLSVNYFVDPEVKAKVRQRLKTFDLDESVIQAQALRNALPELEMIEKIVTSA